MLSTCSEPMSNRSFVTFATSWLSRMPGLSCSAMSWYAPSTMAQAVLSSMISSSDFTSRASSITCCASRTVMPSASSAASIGGSTMSTPSGMSATPSARGSRAISRAAAREQARLGGDGTAQSHHPAADVLRRQPRAVEPVVLRGRPEVPEVRRPAARQQRVPGHLVAGPLADVGARRVSDVVEVEQQHRAEVGCGQRLAGTSEPVRRAAARVRRAPPSRPSSIRGRQTGGSRAPGSWRRPPGQLRRRRSQHPLLAMTANPIARAAERVRDEQPVRPRSMPPRALEFNAAPHLDEVCSGTTLGRPASPASGNRSIACRQSSSPSRCSTA